MKFAVGQEVIISVPPTHRKDVMLMKGLEGKRVRIKVIPRKDDDTEVDCYRTHSR
jgi:hypothetical protein